MPRYIDLDELLKYPIRIDHYDKEHGNTNFVYGIESVIEYAEHLPIYEVLPTEPDDIVVMSIARNTLTYEETIRYFNSLKEAIPNKAICVMDDVKIGVKKEGD